MMSYYLRRKKDIENVDSKVIQTKNGKTMLLSEWAICCSEKSRFIKE